MKPLADCKLYAFVDTAYLRGRAPDFVARELCSGGADIIQLRAKTSSPEEIRAMAESILPITRDAGVHLVINDHPEVAARLGVMCHLGQEDFFDTGHTQASEIRAPLGLSTHAPEQARRAVAAAPAYVAIGPVYPTATKPGVKAVTLDYVRWAAAHITIPWFAIGGINLRNIEEVLAAGARRICIVSAILGNDDLAAACREVKSHLPQ